MEQWCTVVVAGPGEETLARWSWWGEGGPDLSLVEALAWLQLAAGRRGGRVVLFEMCPDLVELLEFTGLRRQLGG